MLVRAMCTWRADRSVLNVKVTLCCSVCSVEMISRTLYKCIVLQCVAVCCSVLQCVAVCCSVRSVEMISRTLYKCIVLQCVAVCCSVLQCVAVCVV